MAYTAGAAEVHVTPSFTGFHKKIGEQLDKEDAAFTRAGDRWGRLSADAFSARWKAANMPTAKIKADIDDLKAKAELADLARTRHAKVKVDVDKTGLGKFGSLLSSVSGGLGKLGGALPGGGAGGTAGLVALGGAVVAIEALIPEVVALVSGFAAAGAGAGAFAALAIPSFKSVSGAYQQIGKDQQAYDRALTKTSRNTALKHLKQDWASLDPAQRTAIKGIQGLVTQYHKLSTAFQPQVMKIFNDGLSIANHLLPTVTPFANSFANALDGLLKRFDKFTQSKGFSDWLNKFGKYVGPAVTAIGNGLGKVATSFGKLLTALPPADVVNGINIAFSVLAGTIDALAYAAKRLRSNWDAITTGFDTTRHFLATAGHDIASGFLGGLSIAIRGAQDFTHAVLTAFGGVVHGADILFGNLPGFGWLKTADREFGSWRKTVDKSFNAAVTDVNNWKTTLDNAPKTAKLKGDITDLQRKLATAKAKLKDPALTATKRAKIEAVISQLQRQLAAAKRALAGLHGKTIYVDVQAVGSGLSLINNQGNTYFRRVAGGLVGHAAGTPSAAPGWALVGERGPELVKFRGGETVLPNSALRAPSLTMPSVPQVRGGDGTLTLHLAAAGNDQLLRAIVDALRVDVQGKSGGDVQKHFGRGKART